MSDHIRLSAFNIGSRVDFNEIGPDDKFVDAASFDALQSKTAALRADLARVTAERDRARAALLEMLRRVRQGERLAQRAHRWAIGRDDVLDDARERYCQECGGIHHESIACVLPAQDDAAKGGE